jgi:hypothetical protein
MNSKVKNHSARVNKASPQAHYKITMITIFDYFSKIMGLLSGRRPIRILTRISKQTDFTTKSQ